jgi:putative transposase
MPRPLRIEYVDAWYHVMNRGINRMKIFTNNSHREMFLKLLENISHLFKIEVHGYCLMDNHYHLLLHTPFSNLSNAMRHLNGVYTQNFNRSIKRDGALFRGRYKAILIEKENYLLKVNRYIHLNPLEANITRHLENYKWSSYPSYIGINHTPWLKTSIILGYFSNAKDYAEFTAEGVDQETNTFYENPKPIIAKQKFIENKINSLSIEYQKATSTDINKTIKTVDIEAICDLIANYFRVEPTTLKKSNGKRKNTPRMLAMLATKDHTLLTHRKISEYFSGIESRSLGEILKRCRLLINTNDLIKKQYEEITKQIAELFDVDL